MTAAPNINLKAIRGAPITVLFAMFLNGGPIGVKKLARTTGYSTRTVSSALEILSDENSVTKTHRYEGWVLTAGGRLLPLSWSETDFEDAGEAKIFHLPPTTTAIKSLNTLEDSAAVVLNPENGNNFTSREVLDVLTGFYDDYKIGYPTCDELACDPYITADYAAAHLKHGRRRGDDIALVIHRMRSHDPPPIDPDDPARYISGEHAEFIEH